MNFDDEKVSRKFLAEAFDKNLMTQAEVTTGHAAMDAGKSVSDVAKQVYGRLYNQNKPDYKAAERSLGSEFANQLAAGWEDMGGLKSGFMAWFGDVINNDEIKNANMQDYMEYKARIEQDKFRPSVSGIEEAWERGTDGDIGAVGRYIVGTFGRQLPNLATSILGGGVTGIIGKAAAKGVITRSVANNLIKGAVDKAAINKVVQYAMTATPSMAMSIGEVAGSEIDLTGDVDWDAPLLFGTSIGLVDAVLPNNLLSRYSAPLALRNEAKRTLAGKLMSGALTGAGREGLTEAVQEAMLITGEKYISPDQIRFFSEETTSRLMNAAAAGAITGGAVNSVSNVIEDSIKLNLGRVDPEYLSKYKGVYSQETDKPLKLTIGQQLFDRMKPLTEKGELTGINLGALGMAARGSELESRAVEPGGHMPDAWIEKGNEATQTYTLTVNKDTKSLSDLISFLGAEGFADVNAHRMLKTAYKYLDRAGGKLTAMDSEMRTLRLLKEAVKQASRNVESPFKKGLGRRNIKNFIREFETARKEKIRTGRNIRRLEFIDENQLLTPHEISELQKQSRSISLKLNAHDKAIASQRERRGREKYPKEYDAPHPFETESILDADERDKMIKERERIRDLLSLQKDNVDFDSAVEVEALDYMLADKKMQEIVSDLNMEDRKAYKAFRDVKKMRTMVDKINARISKIRNSDAYNKAKSRTETGEFRLSNEQMEILENQAPIDLSPEQQQLNDDITKSLEQLRDFAIKMDLVDPEFAAQWEQDIYTPMYRDMSDDYVKYDAESVTQKVGEGINPNNKVTGGAGLEIKDPIKQFSKMVQYIIRRGTENHRLKQSFRALNNLDLIEGVTGNDANVKVVDKQGPDTITFLNKGKPVHFKVKDAGVFEALQPMAPKYLKGPFGKALSFVKNAFTKGTTMTPDFAIANFFRDTVFTSLVRPGFIPVWDSLRGMISIFNNSPAYQQMRDANFTFGTIMGAGDRSQKRWYYDHLADNKHTFNPFNPIKWWNAFGGMLENAARVRVFEQELKKGKTVLDAGSTAKGLTDFTAHGSSQIVNLLSQAVPFFNATLVSYDAMIKNIAKHPVRFFVKGMGLAAATWGLYSWNKEFNKEEWEELPDHERLMYWHHWTTDPDTGKKTHWRIPKPFQPGYFFGTMTEAMLDTFEGNEDLEHLQKMGWMVTKEFFGIDFMPQAIKPMLEVYMNKNMFTGRPIVSPFKERNLPETQFDAFTRPSMIAAGRMTGESPKKIEHLLRGYFGSMVNYAFSVTDGMVQASYDYPDKPGDKNNLPMLGPIYARFMRESVNDQSKSMQTFYETYNNTMGVTNGIANIIKTGDTERAASLQRKHEKIIQNKKLVVATGKFIRDINKKIAAINFNSSLSREEKDKRIEVFKKMRDSRAKWLNEIVKN